MVVSIMVISYIGCGLIFYSMTKECKPDAISSRVAFISALWPITIPIGYVMGVRRMYLKLKNQQRSDG